MSSVPVIKAEHLGITFGGLHAVSDFNMEMNEGELVGLIGPNGAGKTTANPCWAKSPTRWWRRASPGPSRTSGFLRT